MTSVMLFKILCGEIRIHCAARWQSSVCDGFLRYLKQGSKGKTSVAALSKAVGIDVETLEMGWRAYSKRIGGG